MGTLPLIAAAALVMNAGCADRQPPPPPATRPAAPLRVVSLAPNITEIICAIGGASRLVGRSNVCDYPPEIVSTLPIVGEFGAPSMERLIAAKPDLVFYADLADKTVPSRLAAVGIQPVHVPCTRLDDVPAAIRTIGQRMHLQTAAEPLAASMENRMAACRANAPPPGRRPRVLVLIWNDPLTAAGNRSFLAELLALAGADNAAGDIQRDYFPVSGEWVVSRDPDVIFCFFMSSGMAARDMVLRRPGWAGVRAVRDGRVYDGMDNNLVLRPGPRMIEGLNAIEQRLREFHDKP